MSEPTSAAAATPSGGPSARPAPSRFSLADGEARLTLWLYAAFFLWWTIGAFSLGRWAQVPVFGMPAWFFVSCVLGYPLVCVALWLVVRCRFTDMPLADPATDHVAGQNGDAAPDSFTSASGSSR